MLEGKSKLHKHGKANTLYISIPSHVVTDSSFPFKEGEIVKVKIDFDFKKGNIFLTIKSLS